MTARFCLDEVLTATGGRLLGSADPFVDVALSTDSRTLKSGQFFIPIVGETFNGHTFVEIAYDQGVAGALVNEAELANHPHWASLVNCIAVPDTTQAYLDLASLHRQRCKAKVVGLTGSSGKTTVKEMLYAAFSPVFKTQCTAKNFNNEIGVSQTLLALEPDTELIIVEMGMRGLNQIRPLSLAAQPDVALVINVGPAHIGLLGSLEAIAEAKCEIFEGLDPQTGVGIYNADNAWLAQRVEQTQASHLLGFSLSEITQRRITLEGGVSFAYQGQTITLTMGGDHFIANALAVLKVAEALKSPIERVIPGLNSFTQTEGRGERLTLNGFNNVTVLNDAYNANPQSMQAVLDHLLESETKPLILVLGGMKELGDETARYHQALGVWLKAHPTVVQKVKALVLVGEELQPVVAQLDGFMPIHYAEDTDTLLTQLPNLHLPLDTVTVFLKGSRSYHLESVVDALRGLGQAVSC